MYGNIKGKKRRNLYERQTLHAAVGLLVSRLCPCVHANLHYGHT